MKVGLLWYDDDPGHDLAEKIGRAARRYRQKFGASPNICYVHRSVLSPSTSSGQDPQGEASSGKVRKVGGVRVSPSPTVLRHHFWLGREEKQHGQRTVK
ncbi:MAG: hypothetical protein KAX24_00815 [Anaerolineae bacterium]|nr:hypothetical protein [Anaerolineae bacterium]